MIYRVFEHYTDENDIDNIEGDTFITECFICYQEDSTPPINLNCQTIYIKTCKCNGFVHQSCLDKWCAKQMKCPMCRSQLILATSITSQLSMFIFTANAIYFSKMLYSIIKFIIFLTVIFSNIETLYTIHSLRNDLLRENYEYDLLNN